MTPGGGGLSVIAVWGGSPLPSAPIDAFQQVRVRPCQGRVCVCPGHRPCQPASLPASPADQPGRLRANGTSSAIRPGGLPGSPPIGLAVGILEPTCVTTDRLRSRTIPCSCRDGRLSLPAWHYPAFSQPWGLGRPTLEAGPRPRSLVPWPRRASRRRQNRGSLGPQLHPVPSSPLHSHDPRQGHLAG